MARGWESKDIESQQDLAEQRASDRARLQLTAEQLDKQARRESLMLDERRLLRDLGNARHPRHQAQVQAALDHIRSRLADVG